MRGQRGTLALALAGLATGCGLGAGPADCAGAEAMAASMQAGDRVGTAVAGSATAHVFELADPDDPNDSAYVFCVDGEAMSGSVLHRPITSDAVAAATTRTMASVGGTNGELEVEWGYLLGRVNRETIESLEVEWTHGDQAGEWTIPVGPGFFLAPVPPGVPLQAILAYRYLDAAGDVVWSEVDGG